MKNLLFSCASLIFIFFVLAFGSNNRQKSYPDLHSEKSYTLNPKLYPLYIEATVFKNILPDLDTMVGKKRLVFEFFFKKNGDLTLALYRGKRNRHDFDSLKDVKLDIQKSCAVARIDTMAVFLGNLEISNQDHNLDSLKKVANSGVKFIVFFPVIDRVVGSNPKKNIIEYVICTANTEAEMCEGTFTSTSTGIIANPSPPRNGN